MKQYAKAFPTFWTGATGRRLSATGSPVVKLLAWYFLTSPAALAADNFGLFYVERDVIEKHVGTDDLDEPLRELARAQFAYWDEITEWVWVREAAAWQYGVLLPKDFLCAHARKWYKTLPRNPWLAYWFDRYVKDLCLQIDAERWVERRDWEGEPPTVAQYIAPVHLKEAISTAPTTARRTTFDRDKALARLKATNINGAIGVAIGNAIVKLEQGDVPLEVIDKQLLDVVLRELGPEVDKEIKTEIEKYRTRMPVAEFERIQRMSRERAAREILRLPLLRES